MKSAVFIVLAVCLTLLACTVQTDSHKNVSPNDPSVNPLLIAATEDDVYWKNAKETVYKTVEELLLQKKADLARGVRHNVFMHGDLTRRQIALTFDDGPHPKFTPRLLAILRKYGVKATFFLVGEQAEAYPKLVKDEVAAGHSIGNHTYHHVTLTKLPPAYVATELKACGTVIQNITGKAPHLFRPPGGNYNDQVMEVAQALGYKTVLWTDDPKDYLSPGEDVIIHRVLRKISNGGIILIHDGVQQTVNALPRLIRELRLRGFEFVTIDQMLEENHSDRERR